MKNFDDWLMDMYKREAPSQQAMPLEPTKTAQDEQTDDAQGVGSLDIFETPVEPYNVQDIFWGDEE